MPTQTLSSNTSTKVLKRFVAHVESAMALLRTVNHTIVDGQVKADTGSTVYVKRPHDYLPISTAAGDISGSTKNVFQAGRAAATVQNCETIPLEWSQLEEATSLDQLDEILKPAAWRLVTEIEKNLGTFAINNLGLAYGSVGTAVDAWSDVAGAGAFMDSIGVPMGDRYYVMNPYVQADLADVQKGLSNGDNTLVNAAWRESTVAEKFAGFRAMASNVLPTRTSSDQATPDRVGAMTSAPDATYGTAKDSMTQSWAIKNFTNSFTLKAGEIIEVTGKHHLSHVSREAFIDGTGASVKFRATVASDASITGGNGSVTVNTPAINEADGQYNTIDSALATDDVITILGSDNTVYQPALMYHKDAMCFSSLKLPPLSGWDSRTMSKDGLNIRFTKYSDGDAGKNMCRVDVQPVFGVLNPFYGGQAYGV